MTEDKVHTEETAAGDDSLLGGARALIGRRVEDEIEVTVPSGDRFYVVEKIEFI